MNEDLKTTAKDVIDLLHSIQDNSPDNGLRVYNGVNCEKKKSQMLSFHV